MKVALYVRVSTEEQKLHGYSTQAQLQELRYYADKHNYSIYKEYIDEGYSGGTLKRPALQELLDDVRDKQFKLIIFVKLDRWFRSVAHYYKIQEVLEENKVEWLTTQEDYETITSSGRFKVNIMLSVSQQFKDATSERVKAVAKYKRFTKGETVNGKCCLGYKVENKHYIIDKENAEKVKFLFNDYIKTNSLNKTQTNYMNKYGFIDYVVVKRRLKDSKYIGIYEKDGIILNDYYPRIIDNDTFNKVQEMLKLNIKKKRGDAVRKRYYIYSGLIKCSICNHNFTGTYHTNTNNKYYRCNHHLHNLCSNTVNINELELERIVLNKIKELSYDKIRIKSVNNKKNEIITIDKDKIKDKLDRLQTLYINGMIELDKYKEQYTQLNKELNTMPTIKKEKIDKELLKSLQTGEFLEIYNKLDDEHKLLFNRNIIKNIAIKDRDNIIVELVD